MEDVRRIRDFLQIRDGYCYGHVAGNGYGDGNGSGSGTGYGDGSGSGYGSGYCSRYGHGYGHGHGSSCGSVYGDGYGYGYSHGSGEGEGISMFRGSPVHRIDGIETIIDRVKGNIARGRILRSDLTTEPCIVVKQDGLFAHGANLHKAMEALRDKLFEGMTQEERIEEFVKCHRWGERYSTEDYYHWHNRLTGSCELGRKTFAADHGYAIDKKTMLTVEEFVLLTENAYGGDVIRRMAAFYGEGSDGIEQSH